MADRKQLDHWSIRVLAVLPATLEDASVAAGLAMTIGSKDPHATARNCLLHMRVLGLVICDDQNIWRRTGGPVSLDEQRCGVPRRRPAKVAA